MQSTTDVSARLGAMSQGHAPFSKDTTTSSSQANALKSKSSTGLLSPRRPAPEMPDLLEITRGSFRGSKLKPRREPEPWEGDGLGTPSEPAPQGILWFDKNWKSWPVALSPDHSTASWLNSRFGGFVTTHQKLRKTVYGRFFEVYIEAVDSRWTDGFGIGVGLHPSRKNCLVADLGGFYEALAWESLPDCWLLGYDCRVKLGSEGRYLKSHEMLGQSWRTSQLQPGDRVGVLATHDGHLMLFLNDVLVYLVTYCNIPWKEELFGILDLDGTVRAAHIVENNGVPSPEIQRFLGSIREADFAKRELLKDLWMLEAAPSKVSSRPMPLTAA